MKTDKSGLPILNQYSEEGFIDCVFRIEELTDTGSHYRFRLRGSFQGKAVGMAVTVVKGIESGMDAKMNLIDAHVYKKGVVFSRTGPESDTLIRVLSTLYGLGSNELSMVEIETFTAIALHQGPLDMNNEPVKLKIFGRDGPGHGEDDYNESFFNLDLKNKLVFWNEKDQEYRKALVRGLSK